MRERGEGIGIMIHAVEPRAVIDQVASRPDPHVPLLVFRPRGLGVDQPAAPAGLRIVLKALGTASSPHAVNSVLVDRKELNGSFSLVASSLHAKLQG